MGPEVGFCPPRILDSVLVLSTWLSNSAPTWTCFSECGWGAASVAEQVAGPWLAPMQHTNHFSASFPSSSTLLRSCFTKSCRPSEQPWPPPEETRKVPRPANSRSQTVLVSRGEGVWDAMFLSCLLSREWHPWSPCCSVQRSCHLLRQRPLWLPPQAAVWKSPKRQQQGAAAVQQPTVGEAPAGCQGLPELGHTGAGPAGRVCWLPRGLATSVLLCVQR